MDYIAPRKMTVTSVSGRSVNFEKGVPTFCPPQMHAELIAVGVVPAEEIPEVVEEGVKEPMEPMARQEAIFAVFEKMVLKGKREEFTGVGTPHLAVLKSHLGWEVASKERDQMWVKFQQERSTT